MELKSKEKIEEKLGQSPKEIREFYRKLNKNNGCQVCGKLSKNVLDEITIEIYDYKCYKCGKNTRFRWSNSQAYQGGDGPYVDRCEYCGAPFGLVYLSDIIYNGDPRKIIKISTGFNDEDKVKSKLIRHHTSYNPEKTIRVCKKCHKEIHNTNKHPKLKPEKTREEWENKK